MVEVVASKNGFFAIGHAEFAEYGKDIVCSAITAITQTAMLGLEEFCNANTKVQDGCISAYVDKPNRISITIVQTMLLGLYQIQRDYPDYLKITENFTWRILNGGTSNDRED